MLSDAIYGGNTMVFVHKDFEVVIQKMNTYVELAKNLLRNTKGISMLSILKSYLMINGV